MYGYAGNRPLVNMDVGPPQPTSSADIYAPFYSAPFPPIRVSNQDPGQPAGFYQRTSTLLSGGTVLHKGFYDLLSMIPTPSSASRFWASLTPDPIAGPRYEDQTLKPSSGAAITNPPFNQSTKQSPGKVIGRRITKDMVSKPTGFMCVPISYIAITSS